MKKILIVDNIAPYRMILKRAIASHGLPTLEATTEDELFAVDPDEIMLVVTADSLPGKSGFEIIEKASQIKAFATIPFFICSTQDDPEFITHCIKSGFKEVLLRPYNRKMIFNKIKTFLVEAGILDHDMFLGGDESETIRDEEKIDFLKELIAMAPEEIMPIHNPNVNTGYAYPAVSEFFGITPGEGYQILRELYENNVISRTLVDKVSLCHTCNYHTINFREVCPKCQSLNINVESIYHHFACGYIGPATDFKSSLNDTMTCPKCDKLLRHIGLDYEKPSDTFICKDCSFICTEPEVEFICYYCHIVAPADKIIVSNIYSYRANAKTEKIVEYNSFSAFDIKEVLINDTTGQFSRDFFNYMLKVKYKEHLEFGDSLILTVISTNGDTAQMEDVCTYMSVNSGNTDLTHKIDDATIIQVSSRRSLDSLIVHSQNIIIFSRSSEQKNDKEVMECKIMIREFKDKLHDIDTFIDQTYDIFLEEKENITEEAMVYAK